MKTLTTVLICGLIFSLSTISPTTLNASNIVAGDKLFKLPDTSLWYVTLEMDLQNLFEIKNTNTFIPAQFSFKDPDGHLVVWEIKLRARGRFRRTNCEFPPLKLKFPKKKMKEAGFGKHNNVKLVTHCDDHKKAKEYLFREYLVYQLYASLTGVSLRTQLIQITYRDSNTGKEMVTYGIFIEDPDALAERLEANECENCFGSVPDEFDPSNIQIHDLFQYMISNTDWSRERYRNIKVFNQKKEGGGKLMVPYDFDFSGLVNASYARPNYDLKQAKLRDRIFTGQKWTEATWANTFQLFEDKQEELMAIVDKLELINSRTKKDIKRFLMGFYEELAAGNLAQKVSKNN